ncbi:MAG: DUF3052 domain-containing protein [Steroidobacteraceae bacterium]
MSGYSGTPLAKKLGIGPGCRLFLRDAPDNYAALVAPLPEGVRVVSRVAADTDIIHVFATRRAQLERALGSSLKAMRADAVIWVSWPKKSSAVASEITEDTVRELALPLELVDIKVCAVDDTWSGLKLVVRRSARGAWPRRERAPSRSSRPASRRGR